MPATAPTRVAVPLAAALRRWRRRRWAIGGLSILVALLLVLADRRGWLLADSGDWARYQHGRFAVARVIDGDTLDVAVPDGVHASTRIRLWGVNAPEIAHPGSTQPAQPLGDEATRFTRRWCEGAVVRLDLEPHQMRDRYGRLLAYIELPDGTVLNERLLAAGLARAEERFPHRDLERYQLIENQARHDRVGLWAGK